MIILNPLFNVLQIALGLYMWAIILSAILSWLVHFGVINTRNQFVSMIGDFLWRITEPALRPIRRFMPNLGGIDISPIILILLIYFLRDLLANIQFRMNAGGF
jgi:YggT family protein